MDYPRFSLIFIDFQVFSSVFIDFSWILMDFHRFPVYFMRFHGFQGQKLGGLWRAVATLWRDHPGPKEEVSKLFYLLKSNYVRVLDAHRRLRC